VGPTPCSWQGVPGTGERRRCTLKVDLVESLRADHVTGYSHEDSAQSRQRSDVILDIGSDVTLARQPGTLSPKAEPRHHVT
jgi:hypothetical protein